MARRTCDNPRDSGLVSCVATEVNLEDQKARRLPFPGEDLGRELDRMFNSGIAEQLRGMRGDYLLPRTRGARERDSRQNLYGLRDQWQQSEKPSGDGVSPPTVVEGSVILQLK